MKNLVSSLLSKRDDYFATNSKKQIIYNIKNIINIIKTLKNKITINKQK